MKRGKEFVGLVLLTLGALVLMFTIGVGSDRFGDVFGNPNSTRGKVAVVVPKTPVTVIDLEPQAVTLIESYSGMLRPFERHTLGFELVGRILEFGKNDRGEPLDDGDNVTAGEALARLDTTLLRAQLDQASALLERVQSDLDRLTRVRERSATLVTDAEYLAQVTEVKQAEASKRIADKNLANATLISPVNARISRRMANVGESVQMHQPIFELIEIDRVLLVVGVPESRVRQVEVGHQVDVELLARDRFGDPLPTRQGEVYRVAEAADTATGLFEVEILVDNHADDLKPGLIAMARIAVGELENAFRLPVAAAVIREGRTMLFSVDDTGHARSLDLKRWIEQGSELILPDLPREHRRVVSRGQHRLVDGREVKIVGRETPGAVGGPSSVTIQPPETPTR